MRRTVPALVLALTLALPAAATERALPNAPTFDHVRGGNVTPPGNDGHVPATQLAQALAGTYEPENFADQRDLYVDWGRKDWSFAGLGGAGDETLGDPYSPADREDVRIQRDEWGVPRIFGETDEAAQFGVGYAVAEDRMFQADIFRHVARGEMAEFIGGQEWFDYDRAWRREFYTDDELLEMFRTHYTQREQDLVVAYLDGLNAYIEEARRDPEKLPAEYVALGIVPEPWELRHALAIYVLQARDAVEGFGQELYNAALLADLEQRHGADTGRRIFEDVRFIRDPGAYTSVPASEDRFPYPGGGFEGLDAPGVALPDDLDQVREVLGHEASMLQALRLVGLARRQASNAITVSPDVTADGRPILLGGPQLDYLAPSIFWEFEVHSPSQHARGIGFAGTAGVALIGKSPTHAWTITYGYTDQIDVFLVPLDPERPDTHYLRQGESRQLQRYSTTVTCKADQVGFASSPGSEDTCDGLPVNQEDVEVVRVPEYGAVIGRVDVGGDPHAVVKVRAHWMEEVANGRPFMTFNQPTTIEDFRAAQEDFNIGLNINYVDDQGHVGFWHVARPPIRAQGTDVRLPTLGDGRFDWDGFIDLDRVPHAIDPDQGYTVNWNNQVAEGWHNGDSNSWGHLQRVDMLARRMEALAARGDITPDDIWRVNREAAFEDGRFADFRPLLLTAFEGESSGGTAARALDVIASWDGQRTASQVDGTWRYDDAAVTIWDRFLRTLQRDVLGSELGGYYDGEAALGPEFAPAFYHLYSTVLLRILLGEEAPLEARHDWLGERSPAEAVRVAFAAAVDELEDEFEGAPETWRGEAVLTTYRSVGLGSVEPHPFMNRGTYNQLAVVDLAVDVPGTPSGETARAPRELPATGGGVALAALLAVLCASALRGTRRRRSDA